MGNTGRNNFKKGHITLHKGRRKYSFKCLNCEKINGAFVPNRKYCNLACFNEYKIKYPKKFKLTGFKKNHKPWNKGKTGVYSEERIKQMSEHKKGKVSPKRGKYDIFKNCVICDNKFKIIKSLERFTCCSKKCRLERYKQKMIGNKINLGRIQSKKEIIKRSKSMIREKHWNWQGGKSFEPYDKTFNNKFKRAIRKRDNQICMLCFVHREKLNRVLDVHHINYDKLMSIPQNCISLCNSCHPKTNQNREHWIKFFQDLLSEKYNYQYSENKEIILEVN